MALEDFAGLVPNAYGANTGNVMTFGNPAFAQPVGTPMGSALSTGDVNRINPREILQFLGYDGDGGPGATGGGPDAAAGVDDGGAVGIGIGPASGSPGTGGLGGLAAGLMGMLGLTTNPIGFMVTAMMNQALGRKSTEQQIMNFINQVTGTGNPESGIGTEGHVGMTGVDPETGITPGMQQAVNDAVAGGSTGGGSGEDGGVASAGGDSAGPGPGVWKGGLVTKDMVRGPKPNKHDDGSTGIKVGEYVLKVPAVTKIGKDVLDKLNSGDFDPAMLRFAVLRKGAK